MLPPKFTVTGNQLPYVFGSDTSRDAALKAAPNANTSRQRVKAAIAKHGPISDMDIARLTGLGDSTVRPRRVELERDGEIAKAGEGVTPNGRRCALWKIS